MSINKLMLNTHKQLSPLVQLLSSIYITHNKTIMTSNELPTTGTRTTLDTQLEAFISQNPALHLGGPDDFHDERSHHTKVFGFHNLEKSKQAPISNVEFTAIRGPHGTIPLRVFYPSSSEQAKEQGKATALIYFHGGDIPLEQ